MTNSHMTALHNTPGRLFALTLGLAAFLLQANAVQANAATLNFESLNDQDLLTNQYPGATFSNAVVLSAGVSLNEFEFPPHSGINVVSDLGAPIAIDFSAPISSFSAYFTYLDPVRLTGYNASNLPVVTVVSAFASNLTLSGDPGGSPNELLGLSFAPGLSRIVIQGDPAGESFTMDDLTFTAATPTGSVPEPATLLPIALACVALLTLRPASALPGARAGKPSSDASSVGPASHLDQ